MQILLIEPFFSGSHQQWASGYQKYSRHDIQILTLPGRHWKWRMFGGAVSLARACLQTKVKADLILASDMLDLPTFLALSKAKTQGVPTAMYFHENQITYPWSPTDPDPNLQRNNQYGFINYVSALAADQVLFNSAFHKQAFLTALPGFLRQFPDHTELDLVDSLQAKSQVLPLGLDLQSLNQATRVDRPEVPVILWNHRWEYDKAPEQFFKVLQQINQHGHDYKLIVLGEAFKHSPAVFSEVKKQMADQILHFGFAEDRQDYAHWLHMADILPVTSRQDFFGGSVVEAMYCQTYPLLPNRLAFPEHIPPTNRAEHLYQNENELLSKLLALFPQINQIRSNTQYRDFVAHYDWRTLAPIYDDRLEMIA